MNEEYLTVTEAAKKLGVSPRTVQRYCKERRLNFTWVNGVRHKEIRILPPITVSQLPGGGRRKNIAGSLDYVTKNMFDEVITDMKHRLEEKDRKIAVLEEELSELKSTITSSKSNIPASREAILSKLEKYLYDFEKIRPAEKKLIVKLADEVRAHGKLLDSLNIPGEEPEDS